MDWFFYFHWASQTITFWIGYFVLPPLTFPHLFGWKVEYNLYEVAFILAVAPPFFLWWRWRAWNKERKAA